MFPVSQLEHNMFTTMFKNKCIMCLSSLPAKLVLGDGPYILCAKNNENK